MVDLNENVRISKIAIWNRSDCCGCRERLSNAKVLLLDAFRNPVLSIDTGDASEKDKVELNVTDFDAPTLSTPETLSTSSSRFVPFIKIKGTTGVKIIFSTDANAVFDASIGALAANVAININATVDYYGKPLSISVGLDPNTNYYISTEDSYSLSRDAFQRVSSIGALEDEMTVS